MSALSGKEKLQQTEQAGPDVCAFANAVAGDLELLALLHDKEPSAEVVGAVQAGPVQDQLGLVLVQDAGLAALEALWLAANALPRPVTHAALDDLAAGYADVYLNHTYRAAPTESVWLTDEGLERQEPMLQVRAFYRRHKLKVADAANRPDDHLVLQLRFIAHLLRGEDAAGADLSTPDLSAAARFMDEHILKWASLHARRLMVARAPDWYAALSLVTSSYLDEVRDHLTALTGIERPRTEAVAAKLDAACAADSERPYVPGVAPSW